MRGTTPNKNLSYMHNVGQGGKEVVRFKSNTKGIDLNPQIRQNIQRDLNYGQSEYAYKQNTAKTSSRQQKEREILELQEKCREATLKKERGIKDVQLYSQVIKMVFGNDAQQIVKLVIQELKFKPFRCNEQDQLLFETERHRHLKDELDKTMNCLDALRALFLKQAGRKAAEQMESTLIGGSSWLAKSYGQRYNLEIRFKSLVREEEQALAESRRETRTILSKQPKIESSTTFTYELESNLQRQLNAVDKPSWLTKNQHLSQDRKIDEGIKVLVRQYKQRIIDWQNKIKQYEVQAAAFRKVEAVLKKMPISEKDIPLNSQRQENPIIQKITTLVTTLKQYRNVAYIYLNQIQSLKSVVGHFLSTKIEQCVRSEGYRFKSKQLFDIVKEGVGFIVSQMSQRQNQCQTKKEAFKQQAEKLSTEIAKLQQEMSRYARKNKEEADLMKRISQIERQNQKLKLNNQELQKKCVMMEKLEQQLIQKSAQVVGQNETKIKLVVSEKNNQSLLEKIKAANIRIKELETSAIKLTEKESAIQKLESQLSQAQSKIKEFQFSISSSEKQIQALKQSSNGSACYLNYSQTNFLKLREQMFSVTEKLSQNQRYLHSANKEVSNLAQSLSTLQNNAYRLKVSVRSNIFSLSKYVCELQTNRSKILLELESFQKYFVKAIIEIKENIQVNKSLSSSKALTSASTQPLPFNRQRQIQFNPLNNSSILLGREEGVPFIIEQINQFTKLVLTKSKMLYQLDRYNMNFLNYVVKCQSALLFICQSVGGTIFFAFFTKIYIENEELPSAFLAALNPNRIFLPSLKRADTIAVKVESGKIVFGKNEFVIHNMQSPDSFKINCYFSTFGRRYFDLSTQQLVPDSDSNEISILQMEIHSLTLEKFD